MADENENNDREGDQGGQSIFDLFEPPPDPDPNQFGKIPVVRREEGGAQQETERQAAAEAEAAGLQHWTAKPTGQVPAVLASESEPLENIKGPSWHGDDPSWSGPDLADVFADEKGVASHNAGARSQRSRSGAVSPPPVTRTPRETEAGGGGNSVAARDR